MDVREEVELYDHQVQAYDRFKEEEDIALFFEMGCGKSLTTLAIAAYKFRHKLIDSILIIAPNDVHYQWATEQCKWLDKMGVEYDVQCVGGRGGKKALVEFPEDGKLHIICTNVDTFSQPTKWKAIAATATPLTMIVLDEATSIKNYDSQRTQHILYGFNRVVMQRRRILENTKIAKNRVVLTGTPVTNGPMDLWCIMEFVHPNFFNRDRYSFQFHYGMFTQLGVRDERGGVRTINVPLTKATWQGIKNCTDYGTAYGLFGCSQDTFMTVHAQDHYEGPYKHFDELKERLSVCAVFCKLSDCVDMPLQNYITHTLTMSPDIAGCYKSMIRDYRVIYEDHEATAQSQLASLTRLQQISSGFIYGKNIEELGGGEEEDIMPNEVTWIGKTNPKLEALKRDVSESDKPLIILTRYTAEASKIWEELKDKYSVMLYTGWKKTDKLDSFKEGKYEILVANTSCIARGFNLQNSHTILFYSNTFSMELRQQAEFRTYRIGQKEACKYIDYVYGGTVDEDIVKALQMKKNMLEYIREKSR